MSANLYLAVSAWGNWGDRLPAVEEALAALLSDEGIDDDFRGRSDGEKALFRRAGPRAACRSTRQPTSAPSCSPDTRLIMNVHYHAAATEQKDDASGLALRWKSTAPAWQSLFVLVGEPGVGVPQNGELMIPAGEKDHVEEYAWKVGLDGKDFPDVVDVRLWAALNHMHKVGVDLKVWVEDRDSGAETCLLQTPRWDFNWQRSYAYDTPIESGFRVRSGDTVKVRCTYDNTGFHLLASERRRDPDRHGELSP